MRRSLLGNGKLVVIDRETDILFKASAGDSVLRFLSLNGIDVVIKEEVTQNILWSCIGEGTVQSWQSFDLSAPDIDIRITAKRMKSIGLSNCAIDIKRFRVDERCNLNYTFINSNVLKTVSDFNVDNISDITNLFYNCPQLEYIEPFYIKENAILTNTFGYCVKISTCPILNIEVASNLISCFSDSGLDNLTNISNKNLKAVVAVSIFTRTKLTSLSNITFDEATSASFDSIYTLIEVSNITLSKATSLYLTSCNSLTSVSNISAPMCRILRFTSCSSLNTFNNIQISPEGLSSGSFMFNACSALTSVPDFDYSAITDGSGMFAGCNALTDFTNLNIDNLINASSMFSTCTSMVNIPNINYSNITNCEYMFYSCTGLLGTSTINFGSVTLGNSLFGNCFNISHVNLTFQSSLNLDLTRLFYGCENLQTVSLEINGSTSYSLSLYSGFYYCTSLTSVVFDINPTFCNYQEAFYNCSSLTSIPTGFTSVGDFRNTFYLCTSLTEVKNITFVSNIASQYSQQMANTYGTFALSGVTTVENVTFTGGVGGGYIPNYYSISGVFESCNNLNSVSNVTIDTSNKKDVIYTVFSQFNNCPLLTSYTPITVLNNGDIDCMQSYNFTYYDGIEHYNNEVNLSWAKSIIEFYNISTVKTINFNIGTLDNNAGYGELSLAGFSNCPQLESLTITNPNNYKLKGVNYFNGIWNQSLPFLDSLPNLTYLRIEGLSRSTIIPSSITDNTMIEQIIDDLLDMTGESPQTLTIGETRKSAVTPNKITSAESKNWIIN